MLWISASKIKYSTVGASFTVTFSVAPDEIGYLQMLNSKYSKLNGCGVKLPTDEDINNAPAIDIVLCEECEYNPTKSRQYYDNDVISHYYWCEAFCKEHGYCPFGKRSV